VEEMYLTDLNDIRVWGRCRKCKGEVGRIFEYGENKEFYEKACRFRESIKL
jgi:peptide methionine sulfoxide reductase MsrB